MNKLRHIVLALLLVCFAASAAEPSLPGAEEIASIMQELSGITGFPVKHPVVFQSITRPQVNEFLKDRVKEAIKPEEIRAEELTLKKFGFVPADFDLKKTTIDLLTEQAAAFYDFHRKKLFISDWASTNMRDMTLVHELAHALADQSFSLEKFTKKAQNDSEKSSARQAVVEGQASWLMTEVLAQRIGVKSGNLDAARRLFSESAESSGGQYPVFDKSPLYLRETLLFPYTQGMQFQQAVFAKDGKSGFAAVFGAPPVSTQQVIHPDKYFASQTPQPVKLPKNAKGYRVLVEGGLGELDHAILLRQFTDRETAERISPHWTGARYRLLERKKDHRILLVYASEWTDAAIARQYFEAYQRVLRGKWKKMQVTSTTATSVAGTGDDGYFVLRTEGNRVISQEGGAEPFSLQ